MSVIVKDMEMPKNCYTCNLCNYYNEPNQGCYCVALRADLHSTDIMKERAKNCPLIKVPPHGRLIDGDALVASFKGSIEECHKWANEIEGGEMYARVSQSLGTFVECSLRTKGAPTIIEAEEGK